LGCFTIDTFGSPELEVENKRGKKRKEQIQIA